MNRYLAPLAVFLVLLVFMFVGLGLNPREVPSPLIDRPAPGFELAELHAPERLFKPESMLGKVWLLNVWASWCVACRDEHPLLVETSKRGGLVFVGLNYKDRAEDAREWLEKLGNPYQLSVMDPDGRVGIDYGVYGVPETFVIDKRGVIRFKQIGPVTSERLQEIIMPLVSRLQGE